MPSVRSRPWWLWFLSAFGLLFLCGALLRSGPVLVVGQTLGTLGLIVAAWVGVRMHRPAHRFGWRTLSLGTIASLVVTVAWLMLKAAIPSLSSNLWSADIGFFISITPIVLAVATMPGWGVRWAGYTEAGIIISGAAVLWWALLVDPLVADMGVSLASAHTLVFPLLDAALVALGLRLLLLESRSVAFLLVALATVAMLTADTAFFVGAFTGALIDGNATPLSSGAWMAAATLFGAAALHPSMARKVQLPDVASTVFSGTRMYIATVVATPILAGAFLMHERGEGQLSVADIVVPVGASALTAALVVLRMRQLTQVARDRAIALERSLYAQEELQEELRHRAQHDVLTGLPNRSLLHDRITTMLAEQAGGALMIIDLDEFKEVNDRFGHAMGDDLLTGVSGRLSELLDGRALVARLDSDEFAMLLSAGEDATWCATEVLTSLRRPFRVQGQELFSTASIGLRKLDPDLLTDDVLRDAYLAVHAAKAAGRDQFAVFDQQMRERRLAVARTVERLRGAVARDELLVHYQPLIRLSDERAVGVEALLRWQPAGEALIRPDQFIPEAESSGLIVPIGAWVLRESCRVVAEWHRQCGALVSVNVSPRQLREPDFGTMVLDALRSSALPASALILEITEGVLVASGQVTEQAIGHLSMLREHGVRVAVDDFGTGYSSLAYLRDLPIDHVKIDRSFMPAPGEHDPVARNLVKAVIDLAAGLGLGTIAEGVETAEQVDLLRELGCERVQGFFFARPLPEAEAAKLLLIQKSPVSPSSRKAGV